MRRGKAGWLGGGGGEERGDLGRERGRRGNRHLGHGQTWTFVWWSLCFGRRRRTKPLLLLYYAFLPYPLLQHVTVPLPLAMAWCCAKLIIIIPLIIIIIIISSPLLYSSAAAHHPSCNVLFIVCNNIYNPKASHHLTYIPTTYYLYQIPSLPACCICLLSSSLLVLLLQNMLHANMWSWADSNSFLG